jgi:geranylgeranyl pyrophosphate synthase
MSYEYKITIKNETVIDKVVDSIYETFEETEILKTAQLKAGKIIVPDFWMSLSKKNEQEIYYAISANKNDRGEVAKIISSVLTRLGLDFEEE